MIGQRVVLRPRSALETADLASAFVRWNARRFAGLLPLSALAPLAAWWAHRELGFDPASAWAAEVAVAMPLAGWATVLAGELMLRPDASRRQVLWRWLRRLPWLAWLRAFELCAAVLSLGLTLRFTVFASEVVLLEGGGLRDVLRRSGALVGVVPLRALGFGAMAALAQVTGAVCGDAAWHGLRAVAGLQAEPSALFNDGMSLPALVGAGLAQAYLAVVRFLLYVDCRTRREGWDLQVQMGALAVAAREGAAVAGAGRGAR